jgi:hypothetical protein
MAHYGWAWDDWNRLGRATMVGHLLECGTQVTGGYFADPGYKDVPGMDRLGYPIAEIDAEGHCTLFKPQGTGGCITTATVKEQLLYEIHDPAQYLTPDVVADISAAEVIAVGPTGCACKGERPPRPDTLKVNVCYATGWFAEAEISYAGPRAAERARLAGQTIQQRLGHIAPAHRPDWRDQRLGQRPQPLAGRRRPAAGQPGCAPAHGLAACRPRCRPAPAARVNALYCCGPAGGGGVRTHMRQRLGLTSCYIAQQHIPTGFTWAAFDHHGAVACLSPPPPCRCTGWPMAARATKATAPTSA